MAKTVGTAFNEFLSNTVNLAKERTDKARNSRDAVIDKINNLSGFFPLYKEKHLHFGSFARRTKIRPIDDIDIMICLSVKGNIEEYGDTIKVVVTNTSNEVLRDCCDVGGYYFNNKYYLNSTKVKNRFKTKLAELHDCRKAELHSNKEAVTLQYSSYEWNFDIVPCLFVSDSYSNGYYLIPDGSGAWKKTDPRKDRDKVSAENTRLGGRVLDLIRLAKYWAKANLGSYIPSYLIETMVVDYCSKQSELSEYVDWRFENLLSYFQSSAYYSVNDMKGIQGNINQLTYEQKEKFSGAAREDYQNAVSAHRAEVEEGNQRKAIGFWGTVFRDQFPSYGD